MRWTPGGRFGIPAAVGLIAAIAAAYVHGIVVAEREQAVAEAHAQLARMSAARAGAGAAAPSPTLALASFPAAHTLPDWLERIERAAAESGVTLARTEYVASPEPAVGLVRYQIALPVTGRYTQVRAFASALLESVPALALQGIAIRRETTGAPLVAARLDVSVYLQGERR